MRLGLRARAGGEGSGGRTSAGWASNAGRDGLTSAGWAGNAGQGARSSAGAADAEARSSRDPARVSRTRPASAARERSGGDRGRPRRSVEYTLIAGRGKAQWTDGDPRKQPTLMKILASRFRKTTAFALQEGKEGWAQRIDAKYALMI